MLLDELNPLMKAVIKNPVAFLGGFASGVLKLDLSQDPVKTWLNQQVGNGYEPTEDSTTSKPKGPQSISIE